MRPIVLLLSLAALAAAPAGAQSLIPLDGIGQQPGPNARAAQRPLGPNAQAAQRPQGPNAAAQARKAPGAYPSCASARAARATPVRRGETGYARHLDPDGDGLACE